MTSLRFFLEAQGFVRVPLKKLSTGHYKLQIKINGKKAQFILDTGASTSCMDLLQASNFLLTPEKSKIKAAGAGAIDMDTKMAKKNSIKIKSMSLNKVNLVLFDLSHVNTALQQENETPVHGILGADLLKKMRVVIDYGRNCFYIKV